MEKIPHHSKMYDSSMTGRQGSGKAQCVPRTGTMYSPIIAFTTHYIIGMRIHWRWQQNSHATPLIHPNHWRHGKKPGMLWKIGRTYKYMKRYYKKTQAQIWQPHIYPYQATKIDLPRLGVRRHDRHRIIWPTNPRNANLPQLSNIPVHSTRPNKYTLSYQTNNPEIHPYLLGQFSWY